MSRFGWAFSPFFSVIFLPVNQMLYFRYALMGMRYLELKEDVYVMYCVTA